jgi:uncharacterized membrane protein
MKILKKILIVIVIIIAVILLIALFVKKDYHVERTIVINKPKQTVFDYVKYLKNQNNFSKWANMDPAMRKSFRGTDGTVGFVSAWDSDSSDVGKGEQEIKKIVPGAKIDYEIRFIKPFESTAPAAIAFATEPENKTKVTWEFNGHMPYPMNIMQLFCNMDSMLGPDLETGLTNLKTILEKQ